MKYLILPILLMLSGCDCSGPEHDLFAKVGDCIYTMEGTVVKIIAEGKYSFEVIDENGTKYTTHGKYLLPTDCFSRVFPEKKK